MRAIALGWVVYGTEVRFAGLRYVPERFDTNSGRICLRPALVPAWQVAAPAPIQLAGHELVEIG